MNPGSHIVPKLLIALYLTTGQLSAFTFLEDHWSPKAASRGIVMRLHIGSAGGTLLDGSTSWREVAETALGIWNQRLEGSHFRFLVVREPTNTIRDGDRLNSVFWSSSVYGKSFGNGVLAVATRRLKKGVRNEADVIFNNNLSWNSYRGPRRTASGGGSLHDFRRIAMHEFGHVLGLNHPDQVGQFGPAIMKSSVGDLDTLQPDDTHGGRFLWTRGNVWRGVINPEPGTERSISTVGGIQVKFALRRGNGSFSGKWISGERTYPFRGVSIHGQGNLLFGGKTGAISPGTFYSDAGGLRSIVFSWEPEGLKVTVKLDPESPWYERTSSGILRSPRYHKRQPVPSWLLTSRNRGYYTIAAPAKVQSPPLNSSSYPQGIGALSVVVSKSGSVRLSGLLADSTKVTAASHFMDETPFYIRLQEPGSKVKARPNWISGSLVFNSSLANSDVRGINWSWIRGHSSVDRNGNERVNNYPEGWPSGIFIDLIGAMYYADPRYFTVYEAIGMDLFGPPAGNAKLRFLNGNLSSPIETFLHVKGGKVLRGWSNEAFLSVSAKTGMMSGRILLEGSYPSWREFRGVVLHKGVNRGGYGFFLGQEFLGKARQSGSVVLTPNQ